MEKENKKLEEISLVEWRVRNKMSQKKLAEKLEVSQSTISVFENGIFSYMIGFRLLKLFGEEFKKQRVEIIELKYNF